jgi:hypothetical protein
VRSDRRIAERKETAVPPASARRTEAPDRRLVALVRLLARHAARQDEEALRANGEDGNADDSTSENAP